MAETREALLHHLLAERVVAIVRLREVAPLIAVAEALYEGGIHAFEFTADTPGALEAIAACRERFGETALIGAGTVLDAPSARQCLDVGAQFLISPILDAAVVEAARNGGALAIPGAMAPQHIVEAVRTGADIVKVFPARLLGPQYIADLLAPLPTLRLMPTGGVGEHNAAAYLRAGAAAVAIGGSLIEATAVAEGNWKAIRARAHALVTTTRDAVGDAAAN